MIGKSATNGNSTFKYSSTRCLVLNTRKCAPFNSGGLGWESKIMNRRCRSKWRTTVSGVLVKTAEVPSFRVIRFNTGVQSRVSNCSGAAGPPPVICKWLLNRETAMYTSSTMQCLSDRYIAPNPKMPSMSSPFSGLPSCICNTPSSALIAQLEGEPIEYWLCDDPIPWYNSLFTIQCFAWSGFCVSFCFVSAWLSDCPRQQTITTMIIAHRINAADTPNIHFCLDFVILKHSKFMMESHRFCLYYLADLREKWQQNIALTAAMVTLLGFCQNFEYFIVSIKW